MKSTKSTTSTKPPASTEFLTSAQLAALLGVTSRQVLYWEAAGLINASLRVGRIVRFDLDAVKASLAGATENAVASKRSQTESP